jgi:hypothetical protein
MSKLVDKVSKNITLNNLFRYNSLLFVHRYRFIYRFKSILNLDKAVTSILAGAGLGICVGLCLNINFMSGIYFV